MPTTAVITSYSIHYTKLYELYLFHWPVFLWVDAHTDLAGREATLAKLALTAVLATASYCLSKALSRALT